MIDSGAGIEAGVYLRCNPSRDIMDAAIQSVLRGDPGVPEFLRERELRTQLLNEAESALAAAGFRTEEPPGDFAAGYVRVQRVR